MFPPGGRNFLREEKKKKKKVSRLHPYCSLLPSPESTLSEKNSLALAFESHSSKFLKRSSVAGFAGSSEAAAKAWRLCGLLMEILHQKSRNIKKK